MEAKSQQPTEKEGVVSTLNGFIEVFNLAKDIASNTPAKAVFGPVVVILAMIRVSHFLVLLHRLRTGIRPG